MSILVGMWGEIAGVLAAISAAFSALQVRALGGNFHPFVINAMRCSIATLGFAVIWWFGSQSIGDWRSAFPLLLTAVLCGLVVGDSLYFGAISRIGSALATPIALSYPVPTTVLAAIFLDEQLSLPNLLGVILGVSAIWIIAAGPSRYRGSREIDRSYWIGVGLAVTASLCWSVSILVLRPALALVPLDFANLMRMGLAGLILPVVGYSSFKRMHAPPNRFSFLALIIGLGATAVAVSYFITTSIYHSGAAIAAILSSMAPVFAAPLAWLIFKETITPRMVLAIGMGIAGIVMVMV